MGNSPLAPSASTANVAISPFGNGMNLSGLSRPSTVVGGLGNSSIGGVGSSFSSSLSLGSNLSSSYSSRDMWGKFPGGGPSYHSWLMRENEREREKERERTALKERDRESERKIDRDVERDREHDRDRDLDRDRNRDHDHDRDNDRDRDRECNRHSSLLSSERDKRVVKLSDDELENSRNKDSEKIPDGRKSPPRNSRLMDYSIASLARDSKNDASEFRSSFDRLGGMGHPLSSQNREEMKPAGSSMSDDRDIVVLSGDRHPSALGQHLGALPPSYYDPSKRYYEDRPRDFDIARLTARHPASLSGLGAVHTPPSIFPPGTPLGPPYLSGPSMPSVSHSHTIPSFTLAPRGYLGMPLGGHSRSLSEGPAPEHLRAVDLMKGAENRP